jgi:hypothetical protein
MELNFKDVNNFNLTKKFILEKLTPKEIVEYYLNINLKYSTLINSPFRKDSNPSFGIKIENNNVFAKDFSTGETFDCFSIVQKLYNVNFKETLQIINNDFNLIKNDKLNNLNEVKLYLNENEELNYSLDKLNNITIEKQDFTRVDVDYWNDFNISISTLDEFNVSSCKRVWLDGKLIRKYSSLNPTYAYAFIDELDKNEYYKIYNPLSKDRKNKFLFNGTKNCIEGMDQLPLHGDILIITKSLKDVMVLYELGYSSISLQGESNKLEDFFYNRLNRRFSKIYSLYDGDEAGLKGASQLELKYNIIPFFIPKKFKTKDISDYIKKYGKNKTELLINRLINSGNN